MSASPNHSTKLIHTIFQNSVQGTVTDEAGQPLVGVNVVEKGTANGTITDFDIDSIPNFNEPIYLSLDIDALEPAFAPGVSHHEPGGLNTRQVLQIIQKIEVPIIGADIVEYNPKRDIKGITAMVCSKFLKEIAAKIIANKA